MTGPVAIFPWGAVIEAFLDPLGLDADDFARRMRGGWLFGYVAGLAAQGRPAVIVYASERTDRPRRLIHAETGAPIWLVPGQRSGEGRTRGSPSLQALQQWRRTPWRAFHAVLRREGCTAVLAQDYEHPRFDALALIARRAGLPLYATFQGGDVTLSPLEARVRRRTLGLCRGLIVPSARERARLTARYGVPDARLHDIPNPVDVTFWRPEPRDAARAALGQTGVQFLAVWHGRIDIRRKALDRLVDAWRRVVAARPDARLVLLGSGQDHQAFAQLLAGAPGIEWTPSYDTDRERLRRQLSAADAYVTLSRVEGMPVAPLEAMGCELPVVASDAHGLSDIFADGEAAGGLLIPDGDPQGAAEALLRVAADPGLRDRLGRAARRRVEQRYAVEAVGRRLAAVLAERPAARPLPRLDARAPCPG